MTKIHKTNDSVVTVDISVCVCTYKRPDLLLILLDSLARQRFARPFEVVVVDNDPNGTGNRAINVTRRIYPHLHLRYFIEPNKGISYARNAAAAIALGTFVAWIDDDETAIADWLHLLSTAQKAHDADAVFGPVLPVFPENSPSWTERSGIFTRPRHPTGVAIDSREARTGNAFMKTSWLRTERPPFDVELANTGGEDHDFFTRIEKKGAHFEWCDEAEVFEIVPLFRQKLDWILERRLRASTNYWRSQSDSVVFGIGRAFSGCALFLVLTFAGATAAPFGFHRTVKLWSLAMGCLGRTLAIIGIKWKGY